MCCLLNRGVRIREYSGRGYRTFIVSCPAVRSLGVYGFAHIHVLLINIFVGKQIGKLKIFKAQLLHNFVLYSMLTCMFKQIDNKIRFY